MLHEEITSQILAAFYAVYNQLGYGFLERVYENALIIELHKRGLKVYAAVNVFPSDDDAFVAKLNPSGTAFVYSTLLGGSRAPNDSSNLNDEANAIAVDSTDSYAWPWAWYLRDYKAVSYVDFTPLSW